MPESIETATFRDAMGHFATGVSIITTQDARGEPYGITVSSFASLSLEPPLVQWSLKSTSYSLPIFEHAPYFAVNVLSDFQEEASRNFCKPIDRFSTVAWEVGSHGLPLLHGSLAWIECAKEGVLKGGDHKIFVGRVLKIRTFDLLPLVHWRGKYAQLQQVA